MDRAERRRHARAEQKARRRLNRPRHGYDLDAVRLQLLDEATPAGIADLIAMDDDDLEELPDGSIKLARSAFEPTFSVDDHLIDLVRLTANVCEVYADSHPNGDEAEHEMLGRCGLGATIGATPKQIEMVDPSRFSSTVMLIATRVALIGEQTPRHR